LEQMGDMKHAFAAGCACAISSLGHAQSGGNAPPPSQLDPVVISAERSRQTTFDAPAAISAVTRETIESAGPQVNLSEALNRVPGISVLNRQNYSQDLQLSIRGFGSRSTFGIRGVRLIVDGIPATMPDGQGQASNIALTSAGRIEVLRGPLAQLYGNAAGGIVQVFTDMDVERPTTTVSGSVGAYGQNKVGVKFGAAGPNDAVVFDASTFHTDGFRPHSKARRDQINGKWQHDVSPDTRFSLIVNSLDQPVSLDPLGLTRAQWEQGLQANVNQDPRKSVLQQQIGSVFEQRLGEATQLTARIYFGQRDLDNALSIPPAVQAPATHSGGIVVFSRAYQGLGVQLSHAVKFGAGQALRLVGGIDIDRSDEDRQGYLNTLGVQGDLKRNERNRADNRDAFAQAIFDIDSQWTATAGVRSSHVRFRSSDRFVTLTTVPPNPDDSGSLSYSATSPVLGVSWRAAPTLNVYANAGQGFETPTFAELSYRPAPLTGLNTDLRASKSRHAEVGAKWKVAQGQRIDAAVFDIATRDEIVVDTNVGGRSTFKNAGKTSRRGIELSHVGQWDESLRSTLSLTLLRARFKQDFISGSGATPNVFSGYHLPGTPERNAFAELAWAPRGAWGGFNAGAEVVRTDKLYVNDLNTDAAPAATVFNLRAGFQQTLGEWQFSQLLRVDNAANRNYSGSVIVNEANSRFFEPAMPRNWLVALRAKYEFR
ncbi:MAG: TonB-dependent receptor, partial [Burkholderiaceae bacterium]